MGKIIQMLTYCILNTATFFCNMKYDKIIAKILWFFFLIFPQDTKVPCAFICTMVLPYCSAIFKESGRITRNQKHNYKNHKNNHKESEKIVRKIMKNIYAIDLDSSTDLSARYI